MGQASSNLKIEAVKIPLSEDEAQLEYNKRMVRLNETVEKLRAGRLALEHLPYGLYRTELANALGKFCEENKNAVYRASEKITYAELDATAKLVEEALELTKNETPDLRLFTQRQLNKKYKEISEKARELEDPKSIFKRKLSKALLGVGVVLVLAAIVAIALLFTPAVVPVLPVYGVLFGTNLALVCTGIVGSVMAKINYAKVYGDLRSQTKMPTFSRNLFLFRDTIKDMNEGRNPNHVSLPRKIARSMR